MADPESPESTYQQASLNELRPLVGQRILSLVRDTEGHFGFKTDRGITVWIMRDPEGNGPGFVEVVQP